MARDYKALFGVSPKDERRLLTGLHDMGHDRIDKLVVTTQK
jgi:hypothetical protein